MHCPRREELSSLESFALDLGDCIGVESCVDLKTDIPDLEEEIISASQSQISRRDKGLEMMKGGKMEEYPPPISWLARTENLPSHMCWVMNRYYTSDGRLIIREEKAKRHEYLQAHRSNGRLILRLVPLTDHDDDEGDNNVHAEEDREVDGFVDVAAELLTENETAKEEESMMPNLSDSCVEKCCGNGCSGEGECHKKVRRRPCMFGMTLPAFRPVHT